MSQPPTIRDVAAEAGVSPALVSIVFREVPGASPANRRRVLEAAERIGYKPNAIASRLRSRARRSLGVFMFDLRNDLTSDVFQGIQGRADQEGIDLVVGVSDPSGERDERTIGELIAARVDAIALISTAMKGAELRQLDRTVPLVSVTRRVNGIDSVVADDAAGSAAVVGHIASLGIERVVYLAPPWDHNARLEGYRAAMERLGLEPEVVQVEYGAEAAFGAARRLIRSGRLPRAIFAYNDLMAHAVLEALVESGLVAPQDVAVAGFDNVRFSASKLISLTSVDQRAGALGALAVDRALSRLGSRRGPAGLSVIEPELVIRRSTAG
ncbi:MAG: LacI family transcriptional regulator [Bifidobacteriaceae bacterium]|nr:LacI family transcriptional regulator [Bifidobacteriaceae bacterium]